MIELTDLISEIKPLITSINNKTAITRVVQLEDQNIQNGDILWCADKNINRLAGLETGTVILSLLGFESARETHPLFTSINWVAVQNPRRTFMDILNVFFVKIEPPTISTTANIHQSVTISSSATIGHNVVIASNCTIGNQVSIGPNTVIFPSTFIEDGVKIGANCTIGGVGFGYEMSDEGAYELIPHIGNVHICQNAEIGNNTAIDRAVIGSTIIGKNVKIDNLVHVAHGVKIDSNSLIIANAMIAGSVHIGKNVWISPSSSLIQKIKVGDGSIVGMGSVVLKDVSPKTIVAGIPAKLIREIP